MDVFHKIERHLEEGAMILLLIGIGVIMLLQVILRYVFMAPLSWAEEVCRYMFVWTAFLSIGYCFRLDKILAVDALYSKFPELPRRVIDVVAAIMTFGLFSFFFYRSIMIFMAIARTGQVSSALEIPMQFVYLAAPVGFGLGVVRYVQSKIIKYKALAKEGGAK